MLLWVLVAVASIVTWSSADCICAAQAGLLPMLTHSQLLILRMYSLMSQSAACLPAGGMYCYCTACTGQLLSHAVDYWH